MENNKKILFDPGYAPIVVDSIGAIGYTYYVFSSSKNIKLKKINFPTVFKKIENLLKINSAFYLGCLLWASYISQFDNLEIEGNKLLGEKITKEEYTNEINFLIELVETGLNRDCKYYTGKTYIPDEKYLPILKTYKEFLIINNGFTNCSNTNQIKLPKTLKKPDSNELNKINEKIQEAIKNKDITSLFECYNSIFWLILKLLFV